jgi:CheY-like chemotaxis protein
MPLRVHRPPKNPLRVLVAEDSTINRRLIGLLLEMMGCQTDEVSNGHHAVEAFQRDAYDLILMDCLMPGLDGFVATSIIRQIERIRGDAQPIPIVALTAVGNFEARCLRAGMNDYLVKPIHRDALCEVIARWVPAPLVTAD